VRHERALYTAGGREALESVRALPNDVDTVMLIGHNPSAGGVDGNVVRVVTPVSDGRARHDHDHDHWAHVAPGSGTLTAHVTPAQSQADDEP
jgi:hypothetical protein